MATKEQINALIKAHFDKDDVKFKCVALQIAAHEAKVGHTSSANEIKKIVQNPKIEKAKIINFRNSIESIELSVTTSRLSDLILPADLQIKINRVLTEYKKIELLRKNGLKNRSKLLAVGEPGTGKTMMASAIANELGMPLFTIQVAQLMTKYMGETSVKLKQVFDQIRDVRGVYLFDEFDTLGSDRNLDNDVGEMRRILNSFLQYLEADDSFSIIVSATNNPNLLDKALFRRFDDILEFKKPDLYQIEKLIVMKLDGFVDIKQLESVFVKALGLSYADISIACDDAIKHSILEGEPVSAYLLSTYIEDRHSMHKYKEA